MTLKNCIKGGQRKEYWREYYQNNKEKRLKGQKKYYRNNRLKCLEKQKKWREKNIQKHRKSSRHWYWNNKEKKQKYDKKYRQQNKEIILKKAKLYTKKNKENFKTKRKEYYNKNKEIILKKRKEYVKKTNYNSKYYQKNKKKENKRYKEYCKTPEGKYSRRLTSIKRRISERNAVFNLTKNDVKEIIKRDEVCVYCGSDEKLTLDHIISVYYGGHTVFHNIVVACLSCNSSKQTKDVFEWCEQKGINVPEIVKKNLQVVQVGA